LNVQVFRLASITGLLGRNVLMRLFNKISGRRRRWTASRKSISAARNAS
jgi:hypothetical protein